MGAERAPSKPYRTYRHGPEGILELRLPKTLWMAPPRKPYRAKRHCLGMSPAMQSYTAVHRATYFTDPHP